MYWHRTYFRATGSLKKSYAIVGIRTQDLTVKRPLCQQPYHRRFPRFALRDYWVYAFKWWHNLFFFFLQVCFDSSWLIKLDENCKMIRVLLGWKFNCSKIKILSQVFSQSIKQFVAALQHKNNPIIGFAQKRSHDLFRESLFYFYFLQPRH